MSKKKQPPAFQVMPALSDEEYAALRDDIERHGVMVPIVVDQHGRIWTATTGTRSPPS